MAQQLYDALAGAFGHGVDRPALNAFVANSQANNGLRTAQTEVALNNAQAQQEEAQARAGLEDAIVNTRDPNGKPYHTPSEAHMLATELVGKFGNAKEVQDAYEGMIKSRNTETLSDPSQLGTPAATAAVQGNTNKLAAPEAVPNEYTVPAGLPPPNVEQTPLGAADTGLKTAQAGLANAQASNPALFHPSAANVQLSPALQKAVDEGRLDPRTVNSRNARILDQMAQNNGTLDFNQAHANANLQANAGFQQKVLTANTLPTAIQHAVDLGSKLNYSGARFVGEAQKWLNGQSNDPQLAEYMPVRNDLILSIANTMRGIGMSDKATQLEEEAWHPTLDPQALQGWARGEMSIIGPRLAAMNRITHPGTAPGAAPAAPPTLPNPANPADPGPNPGVVPDGTTAINRQTGARMIRKGGIWQLIQ